jgi:hypothetical protein
MIEDLAINKITFWQPSAGGTVTGIIQGNNTFNNPPYDELKTLLLQANDGSVVGVTLNRYLLHSLKQHNATQGDLVSVTFHGKEQKNNGRSFNRYTLLIEKTT